LEPSLTARFQFLWQILAGECLSEAGEPTMS